MTDASGIPASIEAQIRARGSVLDLPLVQSLYQQALEVQPRNGVEVTRDLPMDPVSGIASTPTYPSRSQLEPVPQLFSCMAAGSFAATKPDGITSVFTLPAMDS